MNTNVNKLPTHERTMVKLYFPVTHVEMPSWKCLLLGRTFLLNPFIKNTSFIITMGGYIVYSQSPCVLSTALHTNVYVRVRPSCPLRLTLTGIPLALSIWLTVAFDLAPQHVTWTCIFS